MRHPAFLKWKWIFLLIPIFTNPPLKASPSDPSFVSNENHPTIEKPALILGQGEQRLLHFHDLLRYSLGGDAVRAQTLSSLLPPSRRVKNTKNSLLLKAAHPGQADLWIWKSDGSTEHRLLQVEKVRSEELKPALERALSRLEEAEILISGGGVILRGSIQTLAESARIHALTQGFPKEVRDETELSELLLDQGQERLQKWLRSSGYDSRLRMERHHGTLFLFGTIEKAVEQASLRKQIQALFPATQIEISTLPDDSPTIYFRVFLLELKKNRFHSLGLSWPSTQEVAFRVSPSGIQNFLQLDLILQELEGEGSVKILSNPELAVRAPGEAELFSGGELPIRTHTQYQSNLMWKNFGLTLKLKVTHIAGEKIRLEIFTEVSHLDPSISEDKVPGIQANRMKTQVDARYGAPLLLSGLLQQGTRQQARGLPLLRKIPVLGALFGSEDYLNERSELVAILLPHSAPPPAPMHRVTSVREANHSLPQGPLPMSREWIAPNQERALREAPNFPWNVLDSPTFSQKRN